MYIYLYIDKNNSSSSSSYRSISDNKTKRKSLELLPYSGIEILECLS